MLIGGIEAGGTKFIYGISTSEGEIIDKQTCSTETPEMTLKTVVDYFMDKEISALGIGSFGPIDLKLGSPTYGYITSTPKPYWGNTNIVGYFQEKLQVPIGFDTDVNGAILAESLWGSCKDLKNCCYITIGTGIGGGILVENQLVHGILHPEIGHILVKQHKKDSFEGSCPFHQDCLEGLASGPAIEKRWGCTGSQLPTNHITWEFEAYYIAQLLVSLILTVSPQRIVLGGGVMHQKQLLPLIHEQVKTLLNGYIKVPQILNDIKDYIVSPSLEDNAGFLGAIALGKSVI